MSGSVSNSSRVPALDGLRGLAATIVVISHSYNALTIPIEVRRELTSGPLALLFSSAGAVQIFFVLSGFVLAGAVERSPGGVGTIRFLVRRVARIHPPYLFALGFAWAASFFYVAVPLEFAQGLSHRALEVHLGVAELLRAAAFPGQASNQLPVGWTLTVEMIFSLLLPLLVWVARRLHWAVLVILSVFALVRLDDMLPFGYAIDFALGIAAYLERERLGRWAARMPAWSRGLFVWCAILVFVSPQLFWPTELIGILVTSPTPTNIAVLAVGSVGLVIAAVTVPTFGHLLCWHPVQVLGRLSFSLYLVHYTVILLLSRLVARPTSIVGSLLFIAVVTGVSIVLSEASWRWVERPSIALGARVARRIGA